MTQPPGPVIVCIDPGDQIDLLVRCGVGMSEAWSAPLYLSTIVVVPPQRPLQPLTDDEVEAANSLLDRALLGAGPWEVAPIQELVVGRDWVSAASQAARDLTASALVVAERRQGPLRLFERSDALRRSVPCVVVTVGPGQQLPAVAAWPPLWLAEAGFR